MPCIIPLKRQLVDALVEPLEPSQVLQDRVPRVRVVPVIVPITRLLLVVRYRPAVVNQKSHLFFRIRKAAFAREGGWEFLTLCMP